MTTDIDFDIFDYDPKEHDLWIAINALRTIVQEGYLPEHEWRLKEVAALLENQTTTVMVEIDE